MHLTVVKSKSGEQVLQETECQLAKESGFSINSETWMQLPYDHKNHLISKAISVNNSIIQDTLKRGEKLAQLEEIVKDQELSRSVFGE